MYKSSQALACVWVKSGGHTLLAASAMLLKDSIVQKIVTSVEEVS